MTWDSLDPELRTLILTVAGALAATVIAYLEKLRRDLAANTAKTEEIHKQTNGRLAAALNDVTKYKAIAERSLATLRYVVSTPAGKQIIEEYEAKRRTRVSDGDFDALVSRITGEDRL